MIKHFLLSTLVLLAISISSIGQTVVYHENFENPSFADSLTSSPSLAWSPSSMLAATGLYCDSAQVQTNDTLYLTTNSFSTLGLSYVILTFDQICKIEFFDAAYLEVSNNNGSTWTRVMGNHYLGNGQFTNIGSAFNASSYSAWQIVNNYAIPTNSWWRNEIFDISSLCSNSSNVKIRFALADVNASGNAGAYGWLIDNIQVNAALDELVPPQISLQQPILQDSVFFKGPFTISAQISDASGIDSALLIYSRNFGPNDTLVMTHNYGNLYTAVIDTVPAFNALDTLCYHVWAMDSSLSQNTAITPANACQSFVIYNAQPYPGCSTAISNFPFIESFDQNFTAGSGSPSYPGTLDTGWTRSPNSGSTYMWLVHSGSTGSSNTGPTGDHGTGNGNYLYTEASYGSAGLQTELLTPCLDLTVINVPVLEFYYHMYGQNMGELHVDIWYGNAWVNDIMTPLIGDQGNSWQKASVNLLNYKGITKVRFRAIKGSSYASDIAIDDLKIWEPPAYDAGMVSIDRPISPANTGQQDVKATFANFGSAVLNKVHINWQVNGNLQTPYVWTGFLSPGTQADSIVIGQFNFISGPSNIKIWTSQPNDSLDGFHANDTIQESIIACTSPLRGIYTIGGVSADFATFGDAVYALENCGIDSSIQFLVNPGTYTEQLDLDTIPGSSILNNIIFESVNGDSSSVVLDFAPSNSIDPYVVRFKGASHVHFKNMTITSTGTSYGRLFVFEDDASYNSIENCILNMPDGNYYYTSAFYSTTGLSQYNRMINNQINNGYYGVYFRGSSSTIPAKGNEFSKNILNNFKYYGVYYMYQDSFRMEQNQLANDTSATSTYPMYIYYGSRFKVNKNNVLATAHSSVYGIRLYYCTSPQNEAGILSNNIMSLNGTSTYPYGLYIYNCNYLKIYYNTVQINVDPAPNGRALYLSSGSNIEMKNNIFANLSTGYAAYVGSSTAITASDFNDYYTDDQNFAYWNGYVNDLAALKSNSGKEQNSVSILPTFISATNGHLTYSPLNNLGTPISGILDDIDGEIRSTTSPSIGADEQPPIPIDAGIAEIISPAATEAEGDSIVVKILVKNFGTDTLTGFSYAYGGIGPTVSQNYMDTILPQTIDTLSFPKIVVSPGHHNMFAFTTLNTDTNNYNDTLWKYFYGIPITDVGITHMLTPDSGQCYTNSENLTVNLKNYGSMPLNMAQLPVTIYSQIIGPNGPISIPVKTINTGTLAIGASAQIPLSTSLDMSNTGDYIFDFWTQVSGDGDYTNDSMATKKIYAFSTVDNFPYSQGFENFTPTNSTSDPGKLKEGWAQNNPSSDFLWYVGQGSTYTSNTGPSMDHSLGSASGKYCYAEAYGYAASTANLVSPCINLSNMAHPSLRFWYHLFGSSIHSLRVDVYAQGQWHYSVGHIMGQQQNNNADAWQQNIVDLSNFAGEIIKIRFRAIKMTGYEADIAIDDIFIYEPVQTDAGVSDDFSLPNLKYASEGAQVPIEVKIENYGLDTIYNLAVGYKVGNNPPVIEQWSGTIYPYGSSIHQFNTPYTVQAGEFNIEAFTMFAGDMSPQNDTGKFAFTGISVFNIPYSDDFEGINYFVSTGGLEQWQRGTPNKNTFTAAHSPNKAWVTSLQDNYLNNSNDDLLTPFFNLSSFPNSKLRFWHRMQSQTDHDAGNIQYSLDGGNTFILLGYIGDPAATHWFNTNIGGTHSWSGPDSGWVYSTYDLSSIASTATSPVQFKFHFISDNTINTFDGWMIDDFEISPDPIAQDAGVESILKPTDYTTPGNSQTVKVRLKNYGTSSLNQIAVHYQVNQGNIISQNWMGILAPGASTDFSFSTAYTAPAEYTLKAWTSLSGDTHSYNDSSSVDMAKDAGVISIIQPNGIIGIGTAVNVQVLIKNFGSDTLTTMDLAYQLAGGPMTTETWNGILAPDAIQSFTFSTPYIMTYGINNFCAKTILSGDTKSSNDKKCIYITGSLGINTAQKNELNAQVKPNPFQDDTQIMVNLESSGHLHLSVFDVRGKNIHSQNFKVHSGENILPFNGNQFEAGLYFYEIQFDGMTSVGKMVIMR